MTNILAWLNPARWLMLALLAGAAVIGYYTWEHRVQARGEAIGEGRATTRYNQQIETQKAQARDQLATATAKVEAAEAALRDFKDHQEIQDAQNRTTVAGLQTRLRTLAGPAGRLRDPNATPDAGCRQGGSGAPGAVAPAAVDRADDPTVPGGLLSAQLSGLLQRLQLEADEINTAYASCRADALSIRRH